VCRRDSKSETVIQLGPTLSWFSLTQLFTVSKAIFAAGSLGKPGETERERERAQETERQKDRVS
jgi:hypothetical protein